MSRLIRRMFDRATQTSSSAFHGRRPIRKAADIRVRLLCQTLEDRLAPATFHVTNIGDDATPGSGSLRDALAQANALPDADTIVFDSPTFGSSVQTISLFTALPGVINPVSITGPALAGSGVPQLIISRDPSAAAFRVFDFLGATGNNYTLSNLQVSGGATTDNAGGMAVRENQSLTLSHVLVSGNSTGGSGGAIFVDNPGGNLTIRNSTIDGNTSVNRGGGVYFAAGGSLLMEDSTVTGNNCVGTGAATTGLGGGLYLYGSSTSAPGQFIVRNSTISGNLAASAGGGIDFYLNGGGPNTLLVQNSTISENSAGTVGGGGINQKEKVGAAGLITIQSSIIANNTAGVGPDLQNPAVSLATVTFSLIKDVTGSNLSPSSGNNVAPGTDPSMDPLANYDGSFQKTYRLKSTSPAINAGSNPSGRSLDETGLPRSAGQTDIGSYEFRSTTAPTAVATAANVTAAGTGTYSFTVTYSAVTGVIDRTSIDGGDVTVTGPGGAIAGITAIQPAANAATVTATYMFIPPANPTAGWDADDYGTYMIAVNGSQVGTIGGSGTSVLPATVGGFRVIIAKTFVITSISETGAGSLRQAILDANARTETNDTIRFNGDPSLGAPVAGINFYTASNTIPVGTGQMSISEGLTIIGPGASLLTLQVTGATATSTNRHFYIYGAARSRSTCPA